ncbi:MAG: hypothetical protein MIL41_09240 [Hyphomicrobiales bacterium]
MPLASEFATVKWWQIGRPPSSPPNRQLDAAKLPRTSTQRVSAIQPLDPSAFWPRTGMPAHPVMVSLWK